MKYCLSILSVLCILMFTNNAPPIQATQMSSTQTRGSIGFYEDPSPEQPVDPEPPGGIENEDNFYQKGNEDIPSTGDTMFKIGYFWMGLLSLLLVTYFCNKDRKLRLNKFEK